MVAVIDAAGTRTGLSGRNEPLRRLAAHADAH